jgi:hypothetical protein
MERTDSFMLLLSVISLQFISSDYIFIFAINKQRRMKDAK